MSPEANNGEGASGSHRIETITVNERSTVNISFPMLVSLIVGIAIAGSVGGVAIFRLSALEASVSEFRKSYEERMALSHERDIATALDIRTLQDRCGKGCP